MSENQYDVVVVGGGPGGYVCAIRAGQLGLKTACVEKRGALGGTCLNVGCIPSKALLQSSEKYAEAAHELAEHGVKIDKYSLDLKQMLARKDQVVESLTKGIEGLFKKNKVEYIKGEGRITAKGEVTVDGKTKLSAKHIVIATGSTHAEVPGVEIDEQRIVSSTGALSLDKVPKHLVVVGGGYIGLEMGAVWHRLGAKVTVVEFLDRLLPGMDSEFGKNFQRFLKKQGFEFRLGTKVTGAKTTKSNVTLTVEPAQGGDSEEIKADNVLVAIGRRPYTDGLGAKELGVEMDKRGFIKVDDTFRTSVDGIYAIGDVIPGPMLAHKAEEEGHALADLLAGHAARVNYATCPGIVYTWPEIAYVGKSEDELKEAGVEYNVGKFYMAANSRARANGFTEGFVKILAEKTTDRVLGAHIMAAEAGNTIHELVMAMEFQATSEDVARAFHGHPTLNEAVKEAAMAVTGKPIHS
ncbi:dihydrolipoyl dehydrogenase [Ferruginivarius sediminum]|uniref:Dihydrolipoyl dehydrogenase n=1 Tax=Ferruginivarius sediminum TaxID=2661937 RepID=A0A369TCC0_9PROT|nr:dihydrolipoyl dehydrogenase [Ferruginivarius sediminum]RDD62930.1 dihydrolipoyl dehydrogenase [Ferruginivarius sediminum]